MISAWCLIKHVCHDERSLGFEGSLQIVHFPLFFHMENLIFIPSRFAIYLALPHATIPNRVYECIYRKNIIISIQTDMSICISHFFFIYHQFQNSMRPNDIIMLWFYMHCIQTHPNASISDVQLLLILISYARACWKNKIIARRSKNLSLKTASVKLINNKRYQILNNFSCLRV